jgi:hypothetical protein
MKDYTLNFFVQNYIEHMKIKPEDKDKTIMAFYAGAQTIFFMLVNAMQTGDKELAVSLQQELDAYKAAQDKETVFH